MMSSSIAEVRVIQKEFGAELYVTGESLQAVRLRLEATFDEVRRTLRNTISSHVEGADLDRLYMDPRTWSSVLTGSLRD